MAAVHAWWQRRGPLLLLLTGSSMVLAALWRLGHAVPFLMWVAEAPHPTDLYARHIETANWFDGVFESRRGAPDYPPASYVLLWPLVGWLDVSGARRLWGLTALASLAVLSWIGVRQGGARSRRQKVVLAVLPFSIYATAATLSVGQLGAHLVPPLAAGMLLLRRGRVRWWKDAAAAGYIALTWLAVSFHQGEPLTVLTGWLREPPNLERGTANLHGLMERVGLGSWVLPVTVVTLLGLGAWVFRHGRADLWILMGVAALVARLGFHHRLYDDVLVLIPMIALFRLAVSSPEGRDPDLSAATGVEWRARDVQAGAWFALVWVTVHLPAQLFALAVPVSALTEAGQAAVWIGALLFLMGEARPA